MRKWTKSESGLWYDDEDEFMDEDELIDLLNRSPAGVTIKIAFPNEDDEDESEDGDD